MIKKLINIKKILFRRFYWLLYPIKTHNRKDGVRKIGVYNFSFIPNNFLNSNSVVYSFGAGEDIHWDIEVIRDYNCWINIFDPTPKSLKHFNNLKDNTLCGKPFNSPAMNLPYNATKEIMDKMNFYSYALYDKDENVRFYEPKNKEEISHSITNQQETEEYISVEAKTLSSLMSQLNHNTIDFLKMDIEGAEYDVIQNIVEKKINIKSICLEFHYSNNLSDFKNVKRIYDSLSLLLKAGYKVIHRNTHKYYTIERG